ncbi:ATP-binding cassette domain-containing protein [Paenibacillus athensensis]|uniref:Multidrug ABC transporter ATP-binding protein n=1 Tax=Paenibacillus athensensis TaxID=1967502 RepID=A0A4Y8PYZ2_9BACL|nr:ATP-binding cassette domain-containing protein [Paenibacillus athensensis]MCD1259367.1 ATP-binding cassette domain-containing protein [Paenibacillus athensensis]
MAAISVTGLNKQYTYYKKEVGLKNSLKNLLNREVLVRDAVKNISFEIEEGEVVGFLGSNGAGKTTTIKMLSGILFPTSGQATVMGYVPWERKKDFKKIFSIVMGQKNQLWWDLPANESFLLNKHIFEIEDKRYDRLLNELVELLDVKELLKVQVRRLSLGERMKMELIAALIHQPRVLFLDEPTIGLDFVSQKNIRDFLKYHNQQTKTTIILTSHYMKDIEDLCKRVMVINKGNMVYDGSISQINAVFEKVKTIQLSFSEPVAVERLRPFGEVKSFDGLNAVIEVDKQELKATSIRLLEGLPVIDFNIEDIPLEEGISLLYQQKHIEGGKFEEVS